MSTPFIPNEDSIWNAIVSAPVAAIAREEGAPLIDLWVKECAAFDAEDKTLFIEVPFYLQIAPNTFIVGTKDRVAADEIGEFDCEWKSTGKHSPARGSFGGWNAELWFEDISKSHQVPTYAAAQNGGIYGVWDEGEQKHVFPPDAIPRQVPPTNRSNGDGWHVLVRAVSKSVPPQIWPSARGAFVTVSAARVEATLNAYRIAAEQIRASRRVGLLPWALPGHWCKKFSKFICEHKGMCDAGSYPASRTQVVGSFSPGSQEAVKAIFATYAKNDKNDIDNTNDLVILSASTLSDWAQCPERFRRSSMSSGHEASDAQETGTVLHSGLSALYEQMRRRG
jgi:hypothetical protein